MGALLALSLAASQKEIQGVISYAAALDVKDRRRYFAPILTRFVRQLPKTKRYWADPRAESLKWCYDTYPVVATVSMLNQLPKIKNQLPDITCPLLAFYSRHDTRVKQSGIFTLFEKVSSEHKELVEVDDSGHELTLDSSWEVVAEKTYQFLLWHGAREVLVA
jgi:carboxylesterase